MNNIEQAGPGPDRLPSDWQDMEMFGLDPTSPADLEEWERTRPSASDVGEHDYGQDTFEFGGPFPRQNQES